MEMSSALFAAQHSVSCGDARAACSHCGAAACSHSTGMPWCHSHGCWVPQPLHINPWRGGGAFEGANADTQGTSQVIWGGRRGLPGRAGSSPADGGDAPCGTRLQVARERRTQRAGREGGGLPGASGVNDYGLHIPTQGSHKQKAVTDSCRQRLLCCDCWVRAFSVLGVRGSSPPSRRQATCRLACLHLLLTFFIHITSLGEEVPYMNISW